MNSSQHDIIPARDIIRSGRSGGMALRAVVEVDVLVLGMPGWE